MKSAHLPGSSEPKSLLLVLGVSRIQRECPECFRQRHGLLGMPTARGLVVMVGAGDGRMQAENGLSDSTGKSEPPAIRVP